MNYDPNNPNNPNSPENPQQPPQMPYYPPAYPYMFPRESGAANTSLIFGILSFVVLPIIGAIVAIVTGINARNEIRMGNGMVTGAGKAQAGIILGAINLTLAIVPVIVIVILALLGPNIGRTFSNIIGTM